MKRNLIVISAMGLLVLAGATHGAVKKGEVELEVLGGWLMESAEEGTLEPVEGVVDTSQVLAGAVGTDLDSWGVMASLGFFTSKNFQLGISGFYTQLEGDTETLAVEGFPEVTADFELEMTMYGVGGRARWHFNPNDKWVLYGGAQGYWVSADVDVTVTSATLPSGTESDSPDGILWGPIGGVRCQLGSHDELILEYQYHLWAGDLDDILEEGHGFFLGWAHRLK